MASRFNYGQAFRCKQAKMYARDSATFPATLPTFDGAGKITIPLNGVTYQPVGHLPDAGGVTLLPIAWFPFSSFTIGALGIGNEYIALAWIDENAPAATKYYMVTVVEIDVNTYNLRVRQNASIAIAGSTILFTGATALSFGVAITLMLYKDQTDNNNRVLYLDANGIGQGFWAGGTSPGLSLYLTQIGSVSLTVAGNNLVLGPWLHMVTDGLGEKPDPSRLTAAAKYPNPADAGVPVKNQWTATNIPGETTKQDAWRDFDPADPNDGQIDNPANGQTADYNADGGVANTTYDQSSRTTAATMASPSFMVTNSVLSITSSTKTITIRAAIADKATAVFAVAANFSSPTDTAWHYQHATWSNDANGNAWSSQAQLDNLEIGGESIIGSQALNQQVTAIMAECFSVTVAAARSRRRALAQVI